jgi:hypothetical protein
VPVCCLRVRNWGRARQLALGQAVGSGPETVHVSRETGSDLHVQQSQAVVRPEMSVPLAASVPETCLICSVRAVLLQRLIVDTLGGCSMTARGVQELTAMQPTGAGQQTLDQNCYGSTRRSETRPVSAPEPLQTCRGNTHNELSLYLNFTL